MTEIYAASSARGPRYHAPRHRNPDMSLPARFAAAVATAFLVGIGLAGSVTIVGTYLAGVFGG